MFADNVCQKLFIKKWWTFIRVIASQNWDILRYSLVYFKLRRNASLCVSLAQCVSVYGSWKD